MFKDDISYINHKKVHLKFLCRNCNKLFLTRKEYQSHYFSAHSKNKFYDCNSCGIVIKSQSNYTRHLKTHFNKKTFLCLKCNKKFTRKDHLIRHKCIHSKKLRKNVNYLKNYFNFSSF